MDDVLPDLKTLEFLEARWRESTSYEQAEIAQAMYTFLLERGVVSDIRQDSEMEQTVPETPIFNEPVTHDAVVARIREGGNEMRLGFNCWGDCAKALIRIAPHMAHVESLIDFQDAMKSLILDKPYSPPPPDPLIAKFALICDLDQSRFHNKKEEIGGGTQHVKLFGDKSAAMKFAADLIRSRTDWIDEAQVTDEETLTAFQDGLGHLEWFHIFAVSE